MSLTNCPRCRERSYEILKTHSYCLCCTYSPDLFGYKKSMQNELQIRLRVDAFAATTDPKQTIIKKDEDNFDIAII